MLPFFAVLLCYQPRDRSFIHVQRQPLCFSCAIYCELSSVQRFRSSVCRLCSSFKYFPVSGTVLYVNVEPYAADCVSICAKDLFVLHVIHFFEMPVEGHVLIYNEEPSYSSIQIKYLNLVFTKSVDSNFRAF